jgi:hypothetical protein
MVMQAMIRVTRLVTALALAGLLDACGGSSSPTVSSTPAPTPTPCTQNVVFQGQGSLQPSFLDLETFTTTSSGRLDVTVDWTFATSTIGVYVVPTNTCALAQFNARTCNFLLRSDSGPKPRKGSVNNLAAGTYDLLVANFASQQESVSVQVVLSSAGCPALAFAAGPSEASQTEVVGQAKSSIGR